MALDSSQLYVEFPVGETTTIGLTSEIHRLFFQYRPTPLTDGTAVDQAQKMITLNPTIDTSGTTYDLSAIAGGPGNANVNFTAIKAIIIQNTTTTAANNVIVGAAAATKFEAWTTVTGSTYIVEPGGLDLKYAPSAAGWAVDSTHKSLKVIAAAGTAVLKIIIVGEGS